MTTTTTTTTTKILLSDLPHDLLGKITKHLDPETRIKLLPESFYQPGDARAAHAMIKRKEGEVFAMMMKRKRSRDWDWYKSIQHLHCVLDLVFYLVLNLVLVLDLKVYSTPGLVLGLVLHILQIVLYLNLGLISDFLVSRRNGHLVLGLDIVFILVRFYHFLDPVPVLILVHFYHLYLFYPDRAFQLALHLVHLGLLGLIFVFFVHLADFIRLHIIG